MHYEQLKTFLTVVELKNFTKTAEALHVTQSTVTARIQQTEAFYGQKLLIRHKGNIELTVIGYKLLPLLQRQMDLWEQTKKIAEEGLEESFQITISAAYSLWRKINTEIIKELYQAYQPTHIHLRTDHSTFVIQHVLDGSTDFGIVYNKPMSKEISSVLIQKDTFHLYKHKDLHISEPAKFQDLVDQSWIYLNWGRSFQSWMENEDEQGVRPKMEVGHSDLAIQFIIDLKGVGFLSDTEVKQSDYADCLEQIEFKSKASIPPQSIYFIFKERRRNEPAMKAMIDIFQHNRPV
ncbi:LysR family transcriptional regulator [Oceanobacillus neutriphilus]|uniref:LysR family transcriptional regulator n=1 Tax=Oceanobacillus neutriphilus TaxID=531815 RepID=A0ABQ2NUI0_9BACI|nr:LysR family transcriptional regulator [Oceanobacillus neutriphilus]GGP10852.1 LysR family transcriptional regulator [Oceanobacillus neutriphilus]